MNYLITQKNAEYLKTADIIMDKTNDEEKRHLLDLIDSLLAIRNLPISKTLKIKQTLKLFKKSKSALPLVKNIKALVWDNRSIFTKIGVGATVGVAMFMPGNAGIAAFGTAIGVPIWVVVGSGYAFASLLAEKLRAYLANKKGSTIEDAIYTVIND